MGEEAAADARRRQILDATLRITARGDVGAATFREVASEAGVSVRLVQYYFGSKANLMLAAQQHVAELATKRLRSRVGASGDDPAQVLRAILTSFLPDDTESRAVMVLFTALHTAALIDTSLRHDRAGALPAALRELVVHQLGRAKVRDPVEIGMEASLLVALVPTVAQAILDGSSTLEEASSLIDYAIERALTPSVSS